MGVRELTPPRPRIRLLVATSLVTEQLNLVERQQSIAINVVRSELRLHFVGVGSSFLVICDGEEVEIVVQANDLSAIVFFPTANVIECLLQVRELLGIVEWRSE